MCYDQDAAHNDHIDNCKGNAGTRLWCKTLHKGMNTRTNKHNQYEKIRPEDVQMQSFHTLLRGYREAHLSAQKYGNSCPDVNRKATQRKK